MCFLVSNVWCCLLVTRPPFALFIFGSFLCRIHEIPKELNPGMNHKQKKMSSFPQTLKIFQHFHVTHWNYSKEILSNKSHFDKKALLPVRKIRTWPAMNQTCSIFYVLEMFYGRILIKETCCLRIIYWFCSEKDLL